MPRRGSGYCSITVNEEIYNFYKRNYESKKKELKRKGINSFSGYITNVLEEIMEKDELLAHQAPFLEEFGYDETTNTIFIKDNRTKRIASIFVSREGLRCDIDDRDDCIHIGFALSLPKVYKALSKIDFKLHHHSSEATRP